MATLTIDEHVADVARQELASRHLLDFANYVYPDWESAQHLSILAQELELLERGENDRTAISLPPGFGKSLLCSQIFPAWAIGRTPKQEMLLGSYGGDLAKQNSRAVRNLLLSESFAKVFPGIEVDVDSSAVTLWETHAGTKVRASGVGGGITGFHGNLVIIDDPLKDWEEAMSQSVKDAVWNWYQNDLLPRLLPGSRVLIIHHRWVPDDLIGRVLDHDKNNRWRYVAMPALNDGKSLWPERYSVADLEQIESDVGPFTWAGKYQQEPMALQGEIIKREWIQVVGAFPPECKDFVIFWDFAATKKDTSAFTARAVAAKHDGKTYVRLSQRREAWADVESWFMQTVRSWWGELQAGRINSVKIRWELEGGSSGIAVEDVLKRLARQENIILPMDGVRPHGSKTFRAQAWASQAKAGGVVLVESPDLPTDTILSYFQAFPNAKFKDLVDATSGAIHELNPAKTTASFKDRYGD